MPKRQRKYIKNRATASANEKYLPEQLLYLYNTAKIVLYYMLLLMQQFVADTFIFLFIQSILLLV